MNSTQVNKSTRKRKIKQKRKIMFEREKALLARALREALLLFGPGRRTGQMPDLGHADSETIHLAVNPHALRRGKNTK